MPEILFPNRAELKAKFDKLGILLMYKTLPIMEVFMDLLPHESESFGWTKVSRIEEDEDNAGYCYLVAENKMAGICVTSWVKKGKYQVGERLEVIKIFQKEASFAGAHAEGYDRYYVRKWKDEQIGKHFGRDRELAAIEFNT